MLRKLAIFLTSSVLLAGCGSNIATDKKLYGANVAYTAITSYIEQYAIDCTPKPKEDACHANVDKAAAVLAEVHPIVVDARKYTGEDIDAAFRELAEANIGAAVAKLTPIAKELGYE